MDPDCCFEWGRHFSGGRFDIDPLSRVIDSSRTSAKPNCPILNPFCVAMRQFYASSGMRRGQSWTLFIIHLVKKNLCKQRQEEIMFLW